MFYRPAKDNIEGTVSKRPLKDVCGKSPNDEG